MNVAVLRASGQNWNPADFLDEHSLSAQAVWQAGDRIGDRIRSNAGFNFTIAEAQSGRDLVGMVIEWLDQHRPAVQALVQIGVGVQVDMGLTVGTSEQFTGSVVVTPQELRLFVDLGIELSISAYPAT
jgi:hypothetical protein